MKPQRRGSVLGANIGSAMEALWSNRLRSFLTLLGIMIGIGAFIAVVTIVLGANEQLSQSQLRFARIISIEQQRGKHDFAFTQNDLQALQKLPHVSAIDASNTLEVNIIYRDKSLDTPTSMVGASANYPVLFPTQLSAGFWWTDIDDQAHKPVAVLGSAVTQTIFSANTNPIGEWVRINTDMYRVIGTLQATGDSSFDNTIFVPYTTVASPVTSFSVQVDDIANLARVQQNVR